MVAFATQPRHSLPKWPKCQGWMVGATPVIKQLGLSGRLVPKRLVARWGVSWNISFPRLAGLVTNSWALLGGWHWLVLPGDQRAADLNNGWGWAEPAD
jgi:hypothetical protein